MSRPDEPRILGIDAVRLDHARMTATMEALAGRRPPGDPAEPRAAEFLARGFEKAGWDVASLEAPRRGPWAWWSRTARRARRFLGGETRTPEGRARLVVARESRPARASRRVVFASNLGPLPRPARGDSGATSGPALLLELARTWPKAWSGRFEPVLAAAGGMDFGFAGLRELVRLVQEEWPPKPTLLVVMLAPGVGNEILISGRPGPLLRQAHEAAGSLWVPVRAAKGRARLPIGLGRPVPSRSLPQIVLAGAAWRDAKQPPIDPAALARAAQLAAEIALRWSRQTE